MRDADGKRFVFVLGRSEAWKVGIGLQRLRRGSQARQLAVCGMPGNEAVALLGGLGWI